MSVYTRFLKLTNEIHDLQKIGSVLGWDQETYMPKGSLEGRAHSRAALSSIIHERITSMELGSLLKTLNSEVEGKHLNAEQRANVRIMKRGYERAVKVPNELMKRLSRTTSLSQKAWQEARAKNDFTLFLPNLEKVVELTRRVLTTLSWMSSNLMPRRMRSTTCSNIFIKN